MEVSCIAISGPHGVGTSSVGKDLAKRLNFRFISAGDIFRESARKRGINIGEFTRIVEGDPFLRNQLDQKMKEDATKGMVVVEGRVSGWITKDVAELRVFLTAPFEVRITRIADREGKPIEVVREETAKREREEQDWFLKMYGIDIMSQSVYNLVIDTADIGIEEVVNEILETLHSGKV